MARVRVVLVEPENPANVGAAARAIANTGLDGLSLVAPGDWKTIEAWRMGWHAEDVLEQAKVYDRLPDALEGSLYVAGLSRRRTPRVPTIPVRSMAEEIARLDADAPACLVFGGEANGLSEEQLLACHRRVSIPSHLTQPSLNLAQAVMVTAYEVYCAGPQERGDAAPVGDAHEGSEVEESERRAVYENSEEALAALRDAFLAIGFLPVQNPEARFSEWRELFGRAGIRHREVKLILALARRVAGAARLAEKAKQAGLHKSPDSEEQESS